MGILVFGPNYPARMGFRPLPQALAWVYLDAAGHLSQLAHVYASLEVVKRLDWLLTLGTHELCHGVIVLGKHNGVRSAHTIPLGFSLFHAAKHAQCTYMAGGGTWSSMTAA